MKKIFFGILICVILLSSCGDADVKEDSELSRNKYKWIEAQISHYKYELTLSCRCSFNDEMPLTIEVLNHKMISIFGPDGNPFPADDPNYMYIKKFTTVENLFREILSIGGNHAAEGEVAKYHPELGYPLEITLDYIKDTTNDEVYITISNFEQLP